MSDPLEKARTVFRGDDLDDLVHRLAVEIWAGRAPEGSTVGPAPYDYTSAKRALELVSTWADQRLRQQFDENMAERSRIEREQYEWWRDRVQLLHARLAMVGEALQPGRKTVDAARVRAALRATTEDAREASRGETSDG